TVAMHCCSFLSSYPALPYTYTLSLHDALPIFLLELLHEQAVGPGEDLPIEVTQLVTGLIGAVLRELDGKATKRRPVDPAEKALHDPLRHDLDPHEASYLGGIEEIEALHHGHGLPEANEQRNVPGRGQPGPGDQHH